MENLMGRYRNITILGAVIIFQVVGLAVQVKRRTENDSTRLIRVWAVTLVTPLERGVVRVEGRASDIWHNYFYLRGVRQQNRELQEQLQQLQLEQVRLRQDAEQAHRLQALLGFKEQFIHKTVAAQVIATSGSEQSRTVYLDKGSADGLAQDMAVISSDGIVGKVSQVLGKHTSQVLLINDQTSGVGTILEQSRLQGVLKGRPTGEIVLDKIMSDEEVKPGDRVLTSGGDQIFPKGLPVGVVANVTRGTEFLQVRVKPAAALNHLEEVLVITKKEEREPAVASSGSPLRAADILAQRLPTVPDKPETASAPAGGTVSSAQGAVKPPSQSPANGPAAKPSTGTGASVVSPGLTPKQVVPSASTGATGAKPQPRILQPGTTTGVETPAAGSSPVKQNPGDVNANAQPGTRGTVAPPTPRTQVSSGPAANAPAASGRVNAPGAAVMQAKPASVPASKPAGTSPQLPAKAPVTNTGVSASGAAATQAKPSKPTGVPSTKPSATNSQSSSQPNNPGEAPQ